MLMGSDPLHSLLCYFLIHDRKLARSKKARARASLRTARAKILPLSLVLRDNIST